MNKKHIKIQQEALKKPEEWGIVEYENKVGLTDGFYMMFIPEKDFYLNKAKFKTLYKVERFICDGKDAIDTKIVEGEYLHKFHVNEGDFDLYVSDKYLKCFDLSKIIRFSVNDYKSPLHLWNVEGVLEGFILPIKKQEANNEYK